MRIVRFFLPLLVVSLIAGCSDNPFGSDEQSSAPERSDAATAPSEGKLRHPQLLSRQATAGKDGIEDTHLFVAFNEYEADGVTRRMLDSYAITRRVLEEYGIKRRVLESYGITHRILNEYGVTRRVLESYAVTRRVLTSYGITASVLDGYGNSIDQSLLMSYGTSYKDLEAHGVSRRVLDEYGVTRRVMAAYGISDEAWDAAVAAFHRSIRLKVRIDSARPGIFVSIGALPLTTFLGEISDDDDISFVEIDVQLQGPTIGTIERSQNTAELTPWGVERIGATESKVDGAASVHVFVLDSGLYANDLNVVERKDFSMLFVDRHLETWDDSQFMKHPYFDPGTAGNPDDETGHGTHIAGTIAALENGHGVIGTAPGAKIHSLKVMTSAGQTDITTLLAAIDYVINMKLQHPTTPIVMNMSLGMNIDSHAYNVLDEGVKRATENGVHVVVSAGNASADASTFSPAHVREAITVGSFGLENAYSTFSNYGAAVDVSAPGEMIASSSNSAYDVANNYAILESGTSMATAHVTGAVVLLLAQYPNASPARLKDGLLGYATPSVTTLPPLTTDRAVWAGPVRDSSGSGSGTDAVLPPFYGFAITSGARIDIYQDTKLWAGMADPNSQGNASFFANQFLDLDNNTSRVHGFSYNAEPYARGSDSQDPDPAVWETWMQDVVVPSYNPSSLPASIRVDPIEIPFLDVSQFKKLATRESGKNLVLNGHYDLGTKDNPTVWLVNGNLTTRGDVTFTGYGVFLVKGTITLNNSIIDADAKSETSLGLYANNSVTFKSTGLTVAAHVFTNSSVLVLRDLTLFGNITAGSNVSWKTQGNNHLYFREAPKVLTDIFWGAN